MSNEGDVADQRVSQPDNPQDQIHMASLGAVPDFSAFYVPTNQSITQPNNFYSSFSGFNQGPQMGFNPYDRQNYYQSERFNPPNRNHSIDPWQQFRQDVYAPQNIGPPQFNQNDFWGQYWSNYFSEAERRGYRPPPPDGPNRRPPGDRLRPPYEQTDRPPPGPPDRTSSRRPMEEVTDPSIVNDISRRRNGERVDPVYVGLDNRESYRGPDGRKRIRSQAAWLDRPAAQAYLMINEELAALGKRLMPASHCADCSNINSLGRTNTQQSLATGLAARPGNSEHERGAALDVKNYADPDVSRLLRKYGFVQGNLSRPNVPIPNDAHHFSFDIRNASRVAQMWEQSEARRRYASDTSNVPRRNTRTAENEQY